MDSDHDRPQGGGAVPRPPREGASGECRLQGAASLTCRFSGSLSDARGTIAAAAEPEPSSTVALAALALAAAALAIASAALAALALAATALALAAAALAIASAALAALALHQGPAFNRGMADDQLQLRWRSVQHV